MVTEAQVTYIRNLMVVAINPPICILGCIANIFNMIIFTRKHMRSSTNIYLTALAFSDLFYLIFSLLELFNYYRFTHFYLAVFFYAYSTIVWLKEAFSYISICITVCFTIERYIAVRYPIHRQRYCTETIAKRIIIIIFIICILVTLPRSLEFKFVHKIKGYNAITDSYCDEIIECKTKYNIVYNRSQSITQEPMKVLCKDNRNELLFEFDKFEFDNCEQIDYYKFLPTELRDNKTYMQVFAVVMSLVFVVIPVIILTVFNTLLVKIVREASRIREKLTQVSRNDHLEKKSSKDLMSMTQENKITMVLISIVIVFLLCQTPWAVYIILIHFTNIMEEQFSYLLAIIFNTLVDLNSAVNLILYCGLSEEYRATSKKLFKSFSSRATSSVKQRSMATTMDSSMTS